MQIPDALDPTGALRDKFGDAVQHVHEFRDETTIVVDAAQISDVMMFLRNTPGLVYNFLSDISAVDYYPNDYGDAYNGEGSAYRPERFGISYHIYSMLYNRRLRIKTFAMEEEPVVPTITDIWQAANWLEREIADLMGIEFEGHPDKRRLIMPDDWDGHPHRRDYPLGKETVQFSFNVEEIMKFKPSAKD
ncbi:MAG: NADH-quinone oxidoreductase subunit C [Aggregatilineales bacterium]